MKAMMLEQAGRPLRLVDREIPRPAAGAVLIRVEACAVCRTDLHVVDGDLTEPKLPLVLGHEIVGSVVEIGAGVEGPTVGDRIGVPWLGRTCGRCSYCVSERENLCDHAAFTGYQIDGGYAELALAAVGVYGVVSYTVTQRTPEIGVRMALGATARAILTMIVAASYRSVLIGLLLGGAGALALSRVLGSLLFEVSPTDPATFAIVGVVLAVAAGVASYLPARRSTRVDPMLPMRGE